MYLFHAAVLMTRYKFMMTLVKSFPFHVLVNAQAHKCIYQTDHCCAAGGGVMKIESHKVNLREKAQPKVGSLDNVSHSPGGGNAKAEGPQETEGSGTPMIGNLTPALGPEPGPGGSPNAQENGLKDGAPSDGEGLQEPQALDSQMPETN
ncbi:hypothetical protein ATANTOWER_006154 [Ataeniobius toweri]|uniref:Microtubule-associated protein n=1 Tax=Ataeniobius toweri TaxID=208326 RepID=A0ABU7CFX5_9TELE|nr:hypothetical protein [Ataeniobius toweri]